LSINLPDGEKIPEHFINKENDADLRKLGDEFERIANGLQTTDAGVVV